MPLQGRQKTVVISALLVVIGVCFWSIYSSYSKRSGEIFSLPKDFVVKQHVFDEAGFIPKSDIGRFEDYLSCIFNESDIDIRFVFLQNTGGKTLEETATDKMQQMGIGKDSRGERGLLLLYDVQDKKLRIEVGYGLEEYFPDAFVGYLVEEHTKDFFAAKDVTTGLKLLLNMIHHRIREAVLRKNFDPKVAEIIQRGYLSGGAGVTGLIPEKKEKKEIPRQSEPEQEYFRYGPQPTPEKAYWLYLQWLAAGRYNPGIALFTPQSQRYLASFPMSRAYFHYILIQEYGRKYKVSIRENLALLYFVDDPLVCPHFFVRDDDGWRMDLLAEVRNTKNIVGGIYIWDYRGHGDEYTKAFHDKLVNIKNYIRIVDGDNRQLPIRRKVE